MTLTIRARLGLAAFAAIAIAGSILAMTLWYSFRNALVQSSLDALETEAVLIARNADEGLVDRGESGAVRILYAALLDSQAIPIQFQGRNSAGDGVNAAVRDALAGRTAAYVVPTQGRFLVASAPVTARTWEGDAAEDEDRWRSRSEAEQHRWERELAEEHDSDAIFHRARVVLLVASSRQIHDAGRTLAGQLAPLIPFAAILAGLGGMWLGWRALAPVDNMSRWAATTGGRDLDERIVVPATGDELARLAGALNVMMGRIEEAFSRSTRFVADASHEMRNPLTNLSTEIQATLRRERTPDEYRAALVSVREEVARLSSLADGLLFLSRADAGRDVWTLERVDLGAVVRDVSESFDMQARAKNLEVRVIAEETFLEGDAAALRRLVENIAGNAIQYTPSGGHVEIRAATHESIIELSVSDDGPGISEEERTHIFERFWRGAHGRVVAPRGAGLGLAICHEVVVAHDGTIEIGRSKVGGCLVRINLPRLHDSFMFSR